MLEKQRSRQSIGDFCTVSLTLAALSEAFDLANEIAPEHLELLVEEPLQWLGAVKNAGRYSSGSTSPEPLGDYYGRARTMCCPRGARRGSPRRFGGRFREEIKRDILFPGIS